MKVMFYSAVVCIVGLVLIFILASVRITSMPTPQNLELSYGDRIAMTCESVLVVKCEPPMEE